MAAKTVGYFEQCVDCGEAVHSENSFCEVCLEDLCESCRDSHMEDYHENVV